VAEGRRGDPIGQRLVVEYPEEAVELVADTPLRSFNRMDTRWGNDNARWRVKASGWMRARSANSAEDKKSFRGSITSAAEQK